MDDLQEMDKPRHILITGASSGIGAALARHYAQTGMTLALGGRNETRLEAIAQTCREKGAVVHTEFVDVRDAAETCRWITDRDDRCALDLVIANAGISGGSGAGADGEPVVQAKLIFDVNVTGVFNTIDPVLPRMLKRKAGQIAIMSSLASFNGWPGAPAYSASKGAVRLYGEGLRGMMTGRGVRINVICPGFIKTPMTDVNDYPMPFLMTDKRAARIIARSLEQNKGRIAFPFPAYLCAGFFGLLPFALCSSLLEKLPQKPAC